MKVLLSLTVLGLTLALAHGFCVFSPHEGILMHDRWLMPEGCTDYFDKSYHRIGSQWNTAECMSCSCTKSGLSCCTRYGGVAFVPGCVAVLDKATCKYVFFKKDHPKELCAFPF